eukprot:TRINITY_DN60098_c0_g1_i1.p1 TRINITY_DN60098_c0_g1~~TRINITY_DN60098_c0_g1_i1.p1  ORF type:complete len:691 (+),score=208.56 TRINITY_DN60098_c0_g1_i1:86-2074(+)
MADKGPPGEEVDVEADSFLPFSLERLTEQLARKITVREDTGDSDAVQADPQAEWARFVLNLRCVCALHYDAVTAKVRMHMTDPVSHPEAEAELVDDLVSLFEAAQFTPLTKEGYDVAQEIDYEFHWPCQVVWSRFDDGFISRWRQLRGSEVAEDGPEFARRLLCFTRGTGSTQKSDRFIMPKLNLVLQRLMERCRRRPRPARGEAVTAPRVAKGPASPAHCIHAPRSFHRQSLADVYPDNGVLSMLCALGRKVTIREPTFKHVCILYKEVPVGVGGAVQAARAALRFRKAAGRRKSAASALGDSQRPPPAAPASTLTSPSQSPPRPDARSQIRVRLYNDVPFGDLEGIFPFKRIELQTIHKVIFFFKIVAAVVVLLLTIRNIVSRPTSAQQQAGGRPRCTLMLLGMMLVAVVKQAVTLVMGYLNMRKEYNVAVENWMQQRTAAIDLPVVSALCDDVRAQEVKEAVLAYFFLWHEGASDWRSISWLDERAEGFLMDDMEAAVDFDCQDAVDKLVSLGLVTEQEGEDGTMLYRVVFSPSEWLARHPHECLTQLRLRAPPVRCCAKDGLLDGEARHPPGIATFRGLASRATPPHRPAPPPQPAPPPAEQPAAREPPEEAGAGARGTPRSDPSGREDEADTQASELPALSDKADEGRILQYGSEGK